MAKSQVSQRVVVHSECLEGLRKAGTLAKMVEENGLKCSYGEERGSVGLKAYESSLVFVYLDCMDGRPTAAAAILRLCT